MRTPNLVPRRAKKTGVSLGVMWQPVLSRWERVGQCCVMLQTKDQLRSRAVGANEDIRRVWKPRGRDAQDTSSGFRTSWRRMSGSRGVCWTGNNVEVAMCSLVSPD